MKVVLTSYTQLGAGGGVPRFNRDLIYALPDARHYSWFDMLKDQNTQDTNISEWDKARVLNQWLIWKKLISKEDIIITDGFWGLGLEQFPNVVSVAHGNWSHTTKDDVEKGILPEFPKHHAVQLRYRQDHLKRGGRIVAVSDFIAHQCDIQWGLKMPVINNGVDLDFYGGERVKEISSFFKKNIRTKFVIHFVTNKNKGFEHVDAARDFLSTKGIKLVLLDESFERGKELLLHDGSQTLKFLGDLNGDEIKYAMLATAELVIHPSAHEGNSYSVLETLASDVPIISYDVGLMYRARKEFAPVGWLLDRRRRSPEETLFYVKEALEEGPDAEIRRAACTPRKWVSQFSVESFRRNWLEYLFKEFGYDPF